MVANWKEEEKQNLVIKFGEMIGKGHKILLKGHDLAILDFVAVFLLIIHNEQCQELLVKHFTNDQFLDLYRCAKHIELALKKYKGNNALLILEAVLCMHQCYKVHPCKSMGFINDSYCFVSRTSTVANELVENSKSTQHHFAYFFEQDYNLILCKISTVSQIVAKKYEKALVHLHSKRANFTRHFITILPQDFVAHQEEILLKRALAKEVELLQGKGSKKKPIKPEGRPKKKEKKVKSYDFKCRGTHQPVYLNSSSDEEEE